MPMHDWSKVTPGEFHDFHGEWISATRRALLDGILPAQYYASIDQHVMGFIPDVVTLKSGTKRRGPAGPVELKQPRARPSVETGVAPYFRKDRLVEIYQVETNRLVRIMDAKDKALYRALLRQQTTTARMNGVVAGEPWGETGYVYVARLRCGVAS